VWLRPIVIGKASSLDWFVAEGETDAARLYGLVGDRCAILVLPAGAKRFTPEWAARIPRGATVALCHDADEDGDAGAEKAAHIIGGRTLRLRPPVEGGDWCDWDGDRQAFLELARRVPDASKLRELDTAALVQRAPDPLHWLADGVYCRGKLTLKGGREKRGKSLVQLALAVCMASGGGEVAGIPVKPGRVLIVDAENGEREIHRRLRASGLDTEGARNLHIAEARGFDLRQDLKLAADLAQRHAVDLLVLDSFRTLWRGDERDEAEVAAALNPIRDLAHDTDIAVSLIHHAQKGGEEYRGSSAIGACIEWCVMLDRDPQDPDKARRRLANPLARFAPERPDRWFRVESEGDDGPVSLEETEAFVREYEAPVREGLEARLREWIAGCGSGTAPIRADTTGTTPEGWTHAELARAVGRRRDDKTVRRAVGRLADLGVIHLNGDGRWQRSETLLDDQETT
jgi:hypothetical protein